MIRRLLVVVALVQLLAGCDAVGLFAMANAPSAKTVVENNSDLGYVAQIDDYGALEHGSAFVAVKPHARTVIDSVGEMNSSTTHVWLWDSDCKSNTAVAGDFGNGGILTVGEAGALTFVPDHTGNERPTELDAAKESCEAAAAELL